MMHDPIQIEPFKLVYAEHSTSVILSVGLYCAEIFDRRKAEGFQGNGYDWGSLAEVFLNEKTPELKSEIHFDPEADMFCAYSHNKQALEKFSLAFHAFCGDKAQMHDLFSRAQLD